MTKQKTEQVNRALEWRQDTKVARQTFMESRREEAVRQRERDRARTESAMAQRRVSLDREVEDARRRYVAFREEKKRAALEREMVMEFNWRQALVTKTVNKHSARQRAFTLHQERSQRVTRSKVQSGSPLSRDSRKTGSVNHT